MAVLQDFVRMSALGFIALSWHSFCPWVLLHRLWVPCLTWPFMPSTYPVPDLLQASHHVLLPEGMIEDGDPAAISSLATEVSAKWYLKAVGGGKIVMSWGLLTFPRGFVLVPERNFLFRNIGTGVNLHVLLLLFLLLQPPEMEHIWIDQSSVFTSLM